MSRSGVRTAERSVARRANSVAVKVAVAVGEEDNVAEEEAATCDEAGKARSAASAVAVRVAARARTSK